MGVLVQILSPPRLKTGTEPGFPTLLGLAIRLKVINCGGRVLTLPAPPPTTFRHLERGSSAHLQRYILRHLRNLYSENVGAKGV